MRKATRDDRQTILDILTDAFAANKSINYIVKQDTQKLQRIRRLMDYSFEMCMLYGNVFISDNNLACALTIYPYKKKNFFYNTWLDTRLIMNCIGFANIRKTLARENLIKKQHPPTPFTYLWFIGVASHVQQQGHGSALLNELIENSNTPIYLETSTAENIPFYKKHGFSIYHEAMLTYPLFFLCNS